MPGEVFQVSQGSGMGMKCSSSIADLAFCHACELMGPGWRLQSTKKQFGIMKYVRVRDNLLFWVRPGIVLMRRLVSALKTMTPWSAELEESSAISIAYFEREYCI